MKFDLKTLHLQHQAQEQFVCQRHQIYYIVLGHCLHVQDEVKALGRLNIAYFLVGFLGFLTTWILDMIYMFLHREGVLRPNQFIKGLFSTCAPHYLLSRCLYDISQTYMEDSGRPNTDPFTYAVTGRVFILLCLQAAGDCCCCLCCRMLTSEAEPLHA